MKQMKLIRGCAGSVAGRMGGMHGFAVVVVVRGPGERD